MTSSTMLHMVLGAAITGITGWIIVFVRTYLAKRVKVTSPTTESIDALAASVCRIVPAVNVLCDNQEPIMQALKALLEAQKGKCNGNIDSALDVVGSAQEQFSNYKKKAAKIPALEVACQ